MTKEVNRPAHPSNIEQDLALMRDYGLEMFWQHKCEQEVVLLCQKYDAGTVRRALAKLTPSGAPRKPAQYNFQVWLAVELFRFYTPAASVKCASDGVARFFLRRSACAKITTAKSWGISMMPINSHNVRRIHSEVSRQLPENHWLRDLLERHTSNPCVVISGSRPRDPKFENAIEMAIADVWC